MYIHCQNRISVFIGFPEIRLVEQRTVCNERCNNTLLLQVDLKDPVCQYIYGQLMVLSAAATSLYTEPIYLMCMALVVVSQLSLLLA